MMRDGWIYLGMSQARRINPVRASRTCLPHEKTPRFENGVRRIALIQEIDTNLYVYVSFEFYC